MFDPTFFDPDFFGTLKNRPTPTPAKVSRMGKRRPGPLKFTRIKMRRAKKGRS